MISREIVMAGKNFIPLSEVVDFLDFRRRPIKEAERKPGLYPYFGANGQQGTIDGFIFDEPLVLLAEDGGFFEQPDRGVAYRVNGKTWVNNHAHVLRPKPCIDVDFLCRVLENYNLKPYVTGTTRGKLTKAGAEEIPVPLPPLADQRRIAAILDQADDLRRKRRAALERHDKITSSLLDVVLNDRRSFGSLVRLDSLIRSDDRINYGVIQPGTEVNDGTPLIRVENLVNNTFEDGSLKKISKTIEAQYIRSRLRGDEVLVACVGSVGAIALAQETHAGFNVARAVARVPIDPSKADRIFIAEWLRHSSTQKYFENEIRAVAQPTLNIKQLCETPIPAVPQDIQRAFAARVAEIDRLKASHRAHLAKLDALFASLQHRAFRGEL